MLGHVHRNQGEREFFCPALSHPHWSPPSTAWPASHLCSYSTFLTWDILKRSSKISVCPAVGFWCPSLLPSWSEDVPRDSLFWCVAISKPGSGQTPLTQTQDLTWRSEKGSALCTPQTWGPGTNHNSTGCHQRLEMACLEADLAQVNPSTPGWNPLHGSADPPSHRESSAQSPLNEVGMFQFKGIKNIFKMWWFPSYQVPAQCTARQTWLFSSQPGA